MALEIVSSPIENGDIPQPCKRLLEDTGYTVHSDDQTWQWETSTKMQLFGRELVAESQRYI